MPRKLWSKRTFMACIGSLAAGSSHSRADATATELFKNKTVTIVTSTGAGGGYDIMARLIAHHLPSHLAGLAGAIVENMPGGGNVRAAAYMYEGAPKDGTAIGVVESATPLNQLLDGRSLHFDPAKFNWLGSTGGRNEVVFVLRSSGIRSIEDLKTKQVALGGTGPGSSIVMYPAAMNNVLGTKFKIVTGYSSSTEVFLAMERGEVAARAGTLASIYTDHADWIREDKILILTQVGLKRDAALPDVPLLIDLAKTAAQRQVLALISTPSELGQPYFAPPGVSPDRVALLRAAFAATLQDPLFIADATKAQADLSPIAADEITRIVQDLVATPPAVVAAARAAIAVDDVKAN